MDRKERAGHFEDGKAKSLSARRAWIENPYGFDDKQGEMGRSPQGERG